MSPVISAILCLVIGYLLGSISVGVIYSKSLGRDIRTAGSKNSGATNMTRIHGMLPGLITFGGDCLKGVIAALIGRCSQALLCSSATAGPSSSASAAVKA